MKIGVCGFSGGIIFTPLMSFAVITGTARVTCNDEGAQDTGVAIVGAGNTS